MRVLVACEFSGIVRDAFAKRGHDAWSCDLLPTERPGNHIQGDVLPHLNDGWDLMIAHPPCIYLSYVGNRWWNQPGRSELRDSAMRFFMALINAPIAKICVENPLGFPCKAYRNPDQKIHPYYFGDKQLKRTCLWLKNLPRLQWSMEDDLLGKATATDKPEPFCYLKTTGKPIHWTEYKHGGKTRSKSWEGIANAMADQWGCLSPGVEKVEEMQLNLK